MTYEKVLNICIIEEKAYNIYSMIKYSGRFITFMKIKDLKVKTYPVHKKITVVCWGAVQDKDGKVRNILSGEVIAEFDCLCTESTYKEQIKENGLFRNKLKRVYSKNYNSKDLKRQAHTQYKKVVMRNPQVKEYGLIQYETESITTKV